MDPKREILCHFLAALAYRTQKAVRGAPASFADFAPGEQVRSPRELVMHMTSVLGHARSFFRGGGAWWPDPLPSMDDELERFHAVVKDLSAHLEAGDPMRDTTPERLLQGPLADAMTHAGQIAMLRRLAGCPIPPENFIMAEITSQNVGPDQASPASPDPKWPEAPSDWTPLE